MSTTPQEFDIPLSTGAVLSDSPFEMIPDAAKLDTGDLTGDPAIAFRRTMGAFATGVTVLTTQSDGQIHGMTANAFMSVSLSPPLVLISLDRRARLCGMLHQGMRYGVSVLGEEQRDLSDLFAGRTKGETEPPFVVMHETPLVDGALAHVVARVVRSYWGGDHSLFLGQVEYARYGEGAPLLFHGGRYERLGREEPVLAALPPELLTPLLTAGVEQRYADGERIMTVGDEPEILAMVLEGSVTVTRPGKQVTLGAGQIIGEIEALDGGARIADITAVGDVRLLEVPRATFVDSLAASPDAALALIRVLASRFRES
ncbi:MAG: flavin reductase [Gaiellales bacterium]